MSTENQDPTGYQDDFEHAATDSARPATGFGGGKPAKKKGSKLPLIIFGVLAVSLLGGAGVFLMGGNKAPAPHAPQKPTTVTAADKAAGTPAAAEPTKADPLAQSPAADPLAPAATVSTTPPAAGTGATPGTTPGAVDPITGLPIAAAPGTTAPGAAPVTTPGAAPTTPEVAGVVPAAGQPTPAPAVGAPTPAPAVGAPTPAPAVGAPTPGAVDPLSQFRDLLAPVDSRVTSLENSVTGLQRDVSDLSGRMSRLEDRRPSNQITALGDSAKASHKAKRRAPAHRVAKAENSVNHVQVEGGRASRVVIVGGASAVSAPAGASVKEMPAGWWEKQQKEQKEKAAAAPSCNLQAIVPGRFWVKTADGTFASYGEGDTWNGSRVEAVTPDRGVKVNGTWTCN